MSKIILLTGATDGIGLLTVEKLAAQGHHLLIHGRNSEKLKAVEAKLLEQGKANVESFQADLANLLNVHELAKSISRKHRHIDVIINNAGIYKTSNPMTKANLDVRFVVNTLAPYLLTKKLLPLMNHTGRVVNLSSAAQESVDVKALLGECHLDDQFSAYAQSKLALTMWSRHMALAIGETGPVIVSVNPGSLLGSKMVKKGFGVEGKSISIGADILIQAALSDEFSGASGLYFDNDIGQFASPHSDALDEQKCETLVGIIEHQLCI